LGGVALSDPEEATSPPAEPQPAAAPATGPAPARAAPKKRARRVILEWGAIVLVALLAAVVLRTFIVQPYYIPSGSMEPTLLVGDKVLVNKLSYDFHGVHRGDVVVFKRPPGDYSPGIKDLIKRVIGLPNDTISASRGVVLIDGQRLAEPWLPRATITADFAPVRVPAGEYFVMGDNRGNSADSRVIGPIPKNLIVGRAFLIVWPLSRIGTL
jgi:signal peptidase I